MFVSVKQLADAHLKKANAAFAVDPNVPGFRLEIFIGMASFRAPNTAPEDASKRTLKIAFNSESKDEVRLLASRMQRFRPMMPPRTIEFFDCN